MQKELIQNQSSMIIAAALWLVTVGSIMVGLIGYANSPGRSPAPPPCWPVESQIPRDASRPTLVLFAHPRCPCTRSSLGELEVLMGRCQARLSARVLFLKPVNTPDNWTKTELWRKASAIPGVSVHGDDSGAEARRFHSETSGQALLYAPDGRLVFQGGITLSRGHSGDNPGRSAIMAWVLGRGSDAFKTPVFGCPLFGAEDQPIRAQCKKEP